MKEIIENQEKEHFWNLQAWKLKDIILVSLLGVMFALIIFPIVHFVLIPIVLVGGWFGIADLPFDIAFGLFTMSAVLGPYIMRKPGVAIVVGGLTGLVQVFMASTFSSTVFISGLVQGLGAEIAFALFRYKKYNWKTMLLAAFGATVASFILAWYRDLLSGLSFDILAVRFILRLISVLIISGVISKLLADKLAKAGVLKAYPIGEISEDNLDD